MTTIPAPYPYFTDASGNALEAGKIYIGTAGLDPRTNPIAVYQDEALTIAWAQPIRTVGGYPVYIGAPSNIQTAALEFSLIVATSTGEVVFRDLNVVSIDAANVRFIQAGTGAVARTAQAKMREVVSVLDFGAKLDGTTNDTQAFRNAVATGKNVYFPEGRAYIIDIITLDQGQTLYGDGENQSVFVIDGGFNLAALGVVRIGVAEPGASLLEVGFEFAQPTAPGTVRADLIQYPPAIYAVNTPRFMVDGVRWTRAWDGIDMTGNSGGAYIGRIESGSFNEGLVINGSLDFIHIESWHNWPFGAATGALLDIWSDGSTTAMRLTGIVDGLAIDKFATFRGKVVFEHDETILPVTIGILQLDGDYSRLVASNGRALISNLYSTKSTTTTVASIAVSGGSVDVAMANIAGGENANQIAVSGGSLRINGGEIFQNRSDLVSSTVSGGVLELKNIAFRWPPGAARTASFVTNSGSGILRILGCTPYPTNSTSTVVIFTVDNLGNYIEGEPLAPHVVGLATTATNGTYLLQEAAFTPTVTASSGTITTASASLRFKVQGRTLYWSASVTVTNNGTGAGVLRITLPLAPTSAAPLYGREGAVTGASLQGTTNPSAVADIVNSGNGYPGVNGAVLYIAGSYPI